MYRLILCNVYTHGSAEVRCRLPDRSSSAATRQIDQKRPYAPALGFPEGGRSRWRNRLKDQTASYGRAKPNLPAFPCPEGQDFSAGERRRCTEREGRLHAREKARRGHQVFVEGKPSQ
jgi:hypothetical protein